MTTNDDTVRNALAGAANAELPLDIVVALSEGSLTRKQLCDQLGVSRTTLGRALSQLLKDHSVTSEIAPALGRGRPVELFEVQRDVVYAIGLDISKTSAQGMVTNRMGEVLAEVTIDNDNVELTPEVVDKLCTTLEKAIEQAGAVTTWVSHIGFGVAKPIVPDNLEVGLKLKELAAAETVIRRYFNAPIVADNSVRMAAIGEANSGAGKFGGLQLFVRVSKGIFACSLTDDVVSSGATGVAGEIGHATISGVDLHCPCGKIGCLETVAALDAVLSAAGVADIDELVTKVEAGDKTAIAACEMSVDALARVLAVAVLMTNPSRIIFDGELPSHVPGYLDKLKDEIMSHMIPGINEDIDFVCSELGSRASLVGAIVCAERFVTKSARPGPYAWHTAAKKGRTQQ